MNRKEFIRTSSILLLGFFTASTLKSAKLVGSAIEISKNFKKQIISIINQLKKEGSNLVKKVMNGKKYKYDPYTHYPYNGGIKDEQTGYQLFFHIHRPNEYGHFHTFAKDENGDLVHLILISMNKKGEPIGLATVNRWVTGDKYVKADFLKIFAERYFVEPSLFKDKRIVEFVNSIFKAYKEEIYQLFDQRDKWIIEYVDKNFREPFEDRDYEILSFKKVDLFYE